MLNIPNASTHAEASTVVPSDDEFLAARIHAYRGKCVALASNVALSQGNVLAQTPDLANVEQVSHSTHIQPPHQSALPRNTSRAPLKAISSTVPSHISTRRKSRTPSEFTLDLVAPFVANLRSNVVAPYFTCVGDLFRPTLSLGIQGDLYCLCCL
jgi:hypothetical protein